MFFSLFCSFECSSSIKIFLLFQKMSVSFSDVRVAHDGEEALLACAEFAPHVILLDLGMPGMDGYEACRRIRNTPQGRIARIIAVTGWGQEEDRRKAAMAGFDVHLVKPVDPDTLMQLLQDAPRSATLDA